MVGYRFSCLGASFIVLLDSLFGMFVIEGFLASTKGLLVDLAVSLKGTGVTDFSFFYSYLDNTFYF